MNFNESIMRVFEVRAKPGCSDELVKKLANTSVSVVSGKSGNLGYFFGKKTSSDGHDFVFVSIWKNLDSIKIYVHPAVPELVNLQNVKGQAKPYQVRQLLRLIERYNLQLQG